MPALTDEEITDAMKAALQGGAVLTFGDLVDAVVQQLSPPPQNRKAIRRRVTFLLDGKVFVIIDDGPDMGKIKLGP